ncbi:MAG: helicase-associated domain-containing protein [Chloroflexota bacterium]
MRRLATPSAFDAGLRAWQAGGVGNGTLAVHEPVLSATIRDGDERGSMRACHVTVRHCAGDEFEAHCECDTRGLCAHAVALMLAWTHERYIFGGVSELSADAAAPSDAHAQWRAHLQASKLPHVLTLARRHHIPTNGDDRARLLTRVAAVLSDPETPRRALRQLSEAQRRVLQMTFLLSDGEPDTLASDLQHALGWQSLGEVEDELRELQAIGLVASEQTQGQPVERYTLAPNVAALIPAMTTSVNGADTFDKLRNGFVRPFDGHLASLQQSRTERSLLEILVLARHLRLTVRESGSLDHAPPEWAQAHSIKVLRDWPYDMDEVVRLQTRPGWLHQSESVLTVPAPALRLDDESLDALRALTNDDALSEFASYLIPPPPPFPSLRAVFDSWQGLATWTELWRVMRDETVGVQRAVLGAQLTYDDWLRQLAHGRRFIIRALSLLSAETWYDFASLLEFAHVVHADFLRARAPFAESLPAWWLVAHDQPVDPQEFASWRDSYGQFIAQVLCGPLWWFGAVEVAHDEAQHMRAFRITPLGAALLRRHDLPTPTTHDHPLRLSDDLTAQLPIGRNAVGAYLTLEQLARFDGLRDGAAHYRFDAQHAHAAFEAGQTADDALAQLAALSDAPAPDAVRAQWHDWWACYARVRWYDGLTLLEFADDYVLHELLTQTDLADHLLFTFGPRLVAIHPDSADAIARQLVKKGYTPKIE